MESEDLKEVRSLPERTELEAESALKLSLFEEALNAFSSFAADSEPGSRELAVATNLHHSYLRRIIKQVTETEKLETSVLYGYLKLLILQADSCTKDFIFNDPNMAEAINKFGERYEGFFRG
ncbi:hypothetical protein [Lysobacter sp. A289]